MSASKVNKGVRKRTVFGGPRALPEDRGADAGRRPLPDGRGIDRRRSRFAEPASQRGIGPRRRRIGQGHLVLGLLALLPMVVAVGAAAGRSATGTYTIVDLGTLGGATSVALGINDLGQVCGSADIPDGNRHAFLWADGVMTDLGTIPGVLQSEAWGINNAGAVVGWSNNTGGTAGAFIWENGQMNLLVELSTLASAYAINDHRQVVGVYRAPPPASSDHAFVWEDGVLTDLTTMFGVSEGAARDINEIGEVIVGPTLLRQDRSVTNIGSLAGGVTQGFGLDDLSRVVGWSEVPLGSGFFHAFLWENGTMTDLAELLGLDLSQATAINNAGQILILVYLFDSATGTGAYVQDLLPQDSGWSELLARDLNNAGQIVGAGTINGLRHAFLMNPPPPPPPIPSISWWGLVLMILGLLTAATIVIDRSKRTEQAPVKEA